MKNVQVQGLSLSFTSFPAISSAASRAPFNKSKTPPNISAAASPRSSSSSVLLLSFFLSFFISTISLVSCTSPEELL